MCHIELEPHAIASCVISPAGWETGEKSNTRKEDSHD